MEPYSATAAATCAARYWLLCAADEAYALNTSLVGSIGVIMASFGFQEALSRLGVERRVLTAGDGLAARPCLA
jgi:protease-4